MSMTLSPSHPLLWATPWFLHDKDIRRPTDCLTHLSSAYNFNPYSSLGFPSSRERKGWADSLLLLHAPCFFFFLVKVQKSNKMHEKRVVGKRGIEGGKKELVKSAHWIIRPWVGRAINNSLRRMTFCCSLECAWILYPYPKRTVCDIQICRKLWE